MQVLEPWSKCGWHAKYRERKVDLWVVEIVELRSD